LAHVREVQNESTFGDGSTGDTGASALCGDGHSLRTGLGEGRENLGLGAGECDAIRSTHAAGFIA